MTKRWGALLLVLWSSFLAVTAWPKELTPAPVEPARASIRRVGFQLGLHGGSDVFSGHDGRDWAMRRLCPSLVARAHGKFQAVRTLGSECAPGFWRSSPGPYEAVGKRMVSTALRPYGQFDHDATLAALVDLAIDGCRRGPPGTTESWIVGRVDMRHVETGEERRQNEVLLGFDCQRRTPVPKPWPSATAIVSDVLDAP